MPPNYPRARTFALGSERGCAADRGVGDCRTAAHEVVRRPGHLPPRPAPSAAAPEMATVRVLVDGPKNATVKVDGQEIVWFGPPHELSVGPHTFQFVPPNESAASPRRP